MHRGFVKIYRKITEWEWYKDPNTKSLFIHLLINANHKDSYYRGHLVKRGDIVIGRTALSIDLGISERSIRTSLKHLKSTGEVTIKSTNKFSVLTVVKYNDYSDNSESLTSNMANNRSDERPASDQQVTTSKECKNEKNEKNIYNNKNKFLKPTLKEIEDYCLERKSKINPEKFFTHYESNGWMAGRVKMKCWKTTIRKWELNNFDNSKNGSVNKNSIHEGLLKWKTFD